MSALIRPVILSGGTGSRLWPVSREGMAKQLLPLTGKLTLLQAALLRVAGAEGFGKPVVIGAHSARFMLRDQIEQVAPGAALLLEPERRDTLAAVLLAATAAAAEDPDLVLAVMPSDHLIRDVEDFRASLRLAARHARAGGVVTIGIAPSGPATGYGYIRPGTLTAPGILAVESFIEKPDAGTAARLIAGGGLWNAGIFVFRAGWLFAALGALYPADAALMREAVAAMTQDLGMLIPGAAFSRVRTISFDRGFMERTDAAFVVPAAFSWSDLGDWNALWTAARKDEDGNAMTGDVVAAGARNTLIRAESRTVCALGVEDLAIVETPDAVLVARRDQAQDVRLIVDALTAAGNPAAAEHVRTHRPWGWFQTTDLGDRFRVKRILVRPGAKLSLQRHRHRAEHWVVVRGTAEVTVDGRVTALNENESAYIPVGAVHRLANPGRIACEIIEVQTGAYLGEDDIERIEDAFGRA